MKALFNKKELKTFGQFCIRHDRAILIEKIEKIRKRMLKAYNKEYGIEINIIINEVMELLKGG